MFNILTYVRVAPATADVHIILEVPATDKNHICPTLYDKHVGSFTSPANHNIEDAGDEAYAKQSTDSHVNSYILIMWCQKGQKEQ